MIELLRELVKAEGTQVDVCRKLGVSQRMMTSMLTGVRRPGLKVLRAIGRAYPGRRKDIDAYIWGGKPDAA